MRKLLIITAILLAVPAALFAQSCPHGHDKQKGIVMDCPEGTISDPLTGLCIKTTS